jgi:tRNA1Val (adenine37-N6)-methyltransferase
MRGLDTSNGLAPPLPEILQPRSGYRYTIDSFLLSSFVTLGKRDTVLDLGSGVGVIGLLLCTRYSECRVWGVEIQERLFRFAEQNRLRNGLEERLTNVLGDFRRLSGLPEGLRFNAAVSNPPYRSVGTGRLNLDDERAVARHEMSGGLSDVIAAARSVIRPGGKIFLIYPASRTADLMMSLRSGNFEPKRARFVHSRQGEEARMVMVEARQGGGAQLKVMPPLYVWSGPGTYSEEVRPMVGAVRPNSY